MEGGGEEREVRSGVEGGGEEREVRSGVGDERRTRGGQEVGGLGEKGALFLPAC